MLEQRRALRRIGRHPVVSAVCAALGVDRTNRHDKRIIGWRRDRAVPMRAAVVGTAPVAGGNDDGNAVLPSLLHREAEGVEAGRLKHGATERKVDHLDVEVRAGLLQGDRSVNSLLHHRVRGHTVLVQDLVADDLDTRSNAVDGRRGAALLLAGDDARHVGAVAVSILVVVLRGEILAEHHHRLSATHQGRMGGIDTAVNQHDAHGRAAALVGIGRQTNTCAGERIGLHGLRRVVVNRVDCHTVNGAVGGNVVHAGKPSVRARLADRHPVHGPIVAFGFMELQACQVGTLGTGEVHDHFNGLVC